MLNEKNAEISTRAGFIKAAGTGGVQKGAGLQARHLSQHRSAATVPGASLTRGAPYQRQFPLKSCRLASQRCEPDAFNLLPGGKVRQATFAHHVESHETIVHDAIFSGEPLEG
jgi:hypothetical protein